jgi:hypothetical protein
MWQRCELSGQASPQQRQQLLLLLLQLQQLLCCHCRQLLVL